MGKIKRPDLVNLVIFCFGTYLDYRFGESKLFLEKEYGEIDYISPLLDFGKFTFFYNKEMGNGKIEGRLISFRNLVHPSELKEIKIFTNKIEKSFSIDHKRTINIDPGYIHHSQFVLASTKHWGNRIYIGKGIFAEITLLFINGKFTPLKYTYQNYTDEEYISHLTEIRKNYLKKR